MTTNYIQIRITALAAVLMFCISGGVIAQETYKTDKNLISEEHTFTNTDIYKVKTYVDRSTDTEPTNIILLIGDGMGVSQIQSGMTANQGNLFLQNFKNVGFSKTQSASDYITDSAAGGTALACGKKTYNGAIGVDVDKKDIKNVREAAMEHGMATGVVATSAVTHATPASFVAHREQRSMYDAIAEDFMTSGIDVFIGGGRNNFEAREDSVNLTPQLVEKGYQMVYTQDDLADVKSGKLAALLAPGHMGPVAERGESMLEVSSMKAIDLLDDDEDGFFLMIEGSQIDWGGHQNNTSFVATEMLDFDRTVGAVLEYAAKHKNTLVIVTADHETGGMTLGHCETEEAHVEAAYSTTHHTGVMVPVFTFGPGASKFTGIIDNTDIANNIFEMIKKK